MGCRYADRQKAKQDEATAKGIHWTEVEYEDIPSLCGRSCKDCPEHYGEDENYNDDICPRCHNTLSDDEIALDYEVVPYGSTTASYPVAIGMKCSKCGYEEKW